MALIECKNCGKMISDKASFCPNCKAPVEIELAEEVPAEQTAVLCEECGEVLPEGVDTCPNCGCPLVVAKEADSETLTEREEPQKVEIAKVSLPGMSKSTKTAICVLAAAAVLILAIFLIISGSNAKKAQAAKEEYYSNLQLAKSTMFSGALEAEKCAGLIHDVWYNSIYEVRDSSTDKYTRKNGGYGTFYDDFNDALSNLFSDILFTTRISGIKSNQSKTALLMKNLKNPPEEYADAYDALKDLYGAYQDITNCAVDPSGSLTTYTQTFNAADNDFLKYYKAVQIYVD